MRKKRLVALLRKAPRSTSFCSLLGGLLFGSLVLGSPPSPSTILGDFSRFPVPGSGSYTTTLSGDFDGNGLEDVVYLAGTTATLVFSPDIYGSTTIYQERGMARPVVSAIAVLAGSPRDELLIADSTGLNAWVRTAQSDFAARPLGGASWANARALTTNSRGDTIYGVSADGLQLGVCTGTTESWHLLPRAGTDLVAFDWDGDGTEELAVATAGGIDVVSPAGALGISFMAPHPVQDVAVIRETGRLDRVAFVGKGPGGADDWIAVVGDQLFPTFVIMGDVDVVGIVAGDLNLDGKDDLVVSRQVGDGTPDILFNLGSATLPSFQVTHGESLESSPAFVNDNNHQTPALTDVDGDGDLEMVILVQQTSECRVYSNTTVEATDTMPQVVAFAYQPNYTTGHFCLEIAAPTSGVPAGATHLEVVLWEMPDPLGNSRTLSNSVAHVYEAPLLTGSHYINVPITIGSPDSLSSIYFWGARYVAGNPATLSYTRVFPMDLRGFTTQVQPLGQPEPPMVSLLSLASGAGAIEVAGAPDGPTLYGLFGALPDPSTTGSSTVVRPLPSTNELPDPKP